MMKQNLAAMIISSLALSACAKTTTETQEDSPQKTSTEKAKQDPELQVKIRKIVEKTKKNMIFVEGGEFLMGDFGLTTRELEKTVPNSVAVKNPKGNIENPFLERRPYTDSKGTQPLHKVTLDSYYLTNNKVTLEDYLYFLQDQNLPSPEYLSFYPKGINHLLPAGANWEQAKKFCEWLGSKIGKRMTLPTEAQWEFAARNRGQYILFATNDGTVKDGENIWSDDDYQDFMQKHPNDDGYFEDLPVLNQAPPNPLGLFDMTTNNYEWVSDWYDENYYKVSEIKNPKGPKNGKYKVLRSMHAQAGSNLRHGDGYIINRHKELPSAIDKQESKEYDLSYKFSFRCAY